MHAGASLESFEKAKQKTRNEGVSSAPCPTPSSKQRSDYFLRNIQNFSEQPFLPPGECPELFLCNVYFSIKFKQENAFFFLIFFVSI